MSMNCLAEAPALIWLFVCSSMYLLANSAATACVDFGSLPEAGLRIAAIKRKVMELAKEGADERHTVNFLLGDEMIVHAQGRH